jgi:WD40 repeat protein
MLARFSFLLAVVPLLSISSGIRADVLTELARWKGHPESVSCMLFSADGTWLVSASYVPGKGNTRRSAELRFWDVHSRKRLGTQPCPEAPDYLALSADGKLLAQSGFSGPIHVSQITARDKQITLSDRGTFAKGSGSPCRVAFGPDGRQLATGADPQVRLWDIASGNLLAFVTEKPTRGHRYLDLSQRTKDVAVGFDEELVGAGGGQT